MKNKETNVRFFLLVILVIILIEVTFDWKNAVQGFKDGFGNMK